MLDFSRGRRARHGRGTGRISDTTTGDGAISRLRHDIRQPLGVVLLLASTLQTEPLLAPALRRQLALIIGEAEWMAELLWADEEGTDHETRFRPIALGDVVDQVCSAVAGATGCTLAVRRDEQAVVCADPVGLHRSVRNLVDNAVRAAGPTGEVVVTLGGSAGFGHVEVSDSGPGFGRVPAQQGLGLLTVRQFVGQSGGALTVGTSELGGACVTLRVPRAVVDIRERRGETA
jgi:signal transduction histidine kinase